MHWAVRRPCASALVVREGKLLLVRRAHDPYRGEWDIPGGFCEPDEHPIRTAEREVREETGVEVRVTGYLGMWLDSYGDEPDPRRRKTTLNVYYHAVPRSPDAAMRFSIDPKEILEVAWFAPDALPEPLAFPVQTGPVVRRWREALRAGTTVTPLLDLPENP
jgi:ADP-ribose pyrophosphatase YjhB (NUDIX family)